MQTWNLLDISKNDSFEALIKELKKVYDEDSLFQLKSEANVGNEIIINNQESFDNAIEQLSKIKENKAFKFYAYYGSNSPGLNLDTKLEDKQYYKCNDNNPSSNENSSKKTSYCSEKKKKDSLKEKLFHKIKKLSKKRKKSNVSRLLGKKIIAKEQINRRDLLAGTDKYLINNNNRSRKKIPVLAKSQELGDLIIEWFMMSKDIVRETFLSLVNSNINNINSFDEFSVNNNLRVRFQIYFKEKNLRNLSKLNKSFSFYSSGINKNWNIDEGKKKMTNFLIFATTHIEEMNGPVSLRDF